MLTALLACAGGAADSHSGARADRLPAGTWESGGPRV